MKVCKARKAARCGQAEYFLVWNCHWAGIVWDPGTAGRCKMYSTASAILKWLVQSQ